MCQYQVNTCSPNPCMNGGTCTGNSTSYTCTCPAAFIGVNCSLKIDYCASSPCSNGGVCKNLPNGFPGYFCNCTGTGFNGTTCSTDVNECSINPNICNNGSCINTFGSFQCNCSAGFTGKDCSKNINECQSLPCQNNGQCFDGINRVRYFLKII